MRSRILFLFLFFVGVLTPLIGRLLLGVPVFAGEQVYTFVMQGAIFSEQGMAAFSSVPLSLLVPLFSVIGGFQALIIVIGLMAASAVTLILCLSHLGFSRENALFIVSMWVISFGYIHAIYSDIESAFVIFLVVYGGYVMLKRSRFMIVPPLLLAMISPWSALAFAIFLLGFTDQIRKRLTWLVPVIALGAALVMTALSSARLHTVGFQLPFQELGSHGGIALVVFSLALIGAVRLWDKRQRRPYLAGFLLILGSCFIPQWLPITALLIYIVAGYCFLAFANLTWSSLLLRRAFVVTAILGISIASLQGMASIINDHPTPDDMQALDYLRSIDAMNILSVPNQGVYITVLGEQTAFVLPGDGPVLQGKAAAMFDAVRMVNLTRDLKEAQISHIYITPAMRDGGIWERPDEKMLLLLEHPGFIELYGSQGYSIYGIDYDAFS